MRYLLLIALSWAVLSSSKCNDKTADSTNNTNSEGTAAKGAHSTDTVTTASGLKYIIWKKGKGLKAEAGDNVFVHYAGRLLSGAPFDNSYDRGKPFDFPLGGGRVIKGWDEGIAYLHVGDSATLIIPATLGYGSTDRPTIPANSTLIFDVQLMDVKKTVKPVPFETKGRDTVTTASGLLYIRLNETKGEQAAAGRNVSVHYTGYLLNGNVFDSSISRGQPISFPLGQGRVIKGWDEGIALLRVGEKARLLIPSALAYGERGAGGLIPPGADLIFDVELMEVK
jgi:peptidylprolyl isomerase